MNFIERLQITRAEEQMHDVKRSDFLAIEPNSQDIRNSPPLPQLSTRLCLGDCGELVRGPCYCKQCRYYLKIWGTIPGYYFG